MQANSVCVLVSERWYGSFVCECQHPNATLPRVFATVADAKKFKQRLIREHSGCCALPHMPKVMYTVWGSEAVKPGDKVWLVRSEWEYGSYSCDASDCDPAYTLPKVFATEQEAQDYVCAFEFNHQACHLPDFSEAPFLVE